ncbi:MAG: hypothetical protein ACXW1Q_09010 [Halobacteriota archaeon]
MIQGMRGGIRVFWIGGQPVPGIAAGGDDGLGVVEQAQRQEALAKVQPDPRCSTPKHPGVTGNGSLRLRRYHVYDRIKTQRRRQQAVRSFQDEVSIRASLRNELALTKRTLRLRDWPARQGSRCCGGAQLPKGQV